MRGRRARPGGGALLLSLILVMTLAAGPPLAGAATVVREWKAKVGTSGANGTATMQAYTTGAGATILKLAKLRASTTLPVVISKGTCSAVGATIVKLPSVKSTSTGAVSKTLGLTAAQVTAIKNASAAGKMAFRVGSGSTPKCGVFTVIPKPPVVGATITVGVSPWGVAVAPEGIFVTKADETLSKVDPATNTVVSTVRLGLTGSAITYGEGALWVTNWALDSAGEEVPGSLLRIDPATGHTVATIPVGLGPSAVVTSPGAVWVANSHDGTISKVDPATNTVSRVITLTLGLGDLAFGGGALWATDGAVGPETSSSLVRIDPATATVTAEISTLGVGAVAVGGGSVWMVNNSWQDTVVLRIDPGTNKVVTTISTGEDTGTVYDLAYGGGYLWATTFFSFTLIQIDPLTNAVRARVITGPALKDDFGNTVGLGGVAATDSSVWVVERSACCQSSAPGKLVRVYF